MTYDELLARVNHIDHSVDLTMDESEQYFFKAVLAVIELHKPFEYMAWDEIYCNTCLDDEGDNWLFYPCPTIQAIEKELA
jgi:hypothetical protein